MSTTRPTREDQKIPTHEDRTSSETSLKTTANGMILIPQPSDDPKDPLVSLVLLSLCLGKQMSLASDKQNHNPELAHVEENYHCIGTLPEYVCGLRSTVLWTAQHPATSEAIPQNNNPDYVF